MTLAIVFFADVRFVHVFNRDAILVGQIMRTLANTLTPMVGKGFGVIEYLDVAGVQKAGHAARVTRAGQSAGDNHPVVTGKHAK